MKRELITEKRFRMLPARYDREQLSSIEQFAEQISGYAGITELNFKIVNQLIEKFSFLNS